MSVTGIRTSTHPSLVDRAVVSWWVGQQSGSIEEELPQWLLLEILKGVNPGGRCPGISTTSIGKRGKNTLCTASSQHRRKRR